MIYDDITHWQTDKQTHITAIAADFNTNNSMINQKTRCWQSGNILEIHLHIVYIVFHTTCTYTAMDLAIKDLIPTVCINTHSVRTWNGQQFVMFIWPTTSMGLVCQFNVSGHVYHNDTSICLEADYSINCTGGRVQHSRYRLGKYSHATPLGCEQTWNAISNLSMSPAILIMLSPPVAWRRIKELQF